MSEITPVGGGSVLQAEVLSLLREAVDAGALPQSAVVVVDGQRHSVADRSSSIMAARDFTTPRFQDPEDGLISPETELMSPSGMFSVHNADNAAMHAALYDEDAHTTTLSQSHSSLSARETTHTDRFFQWLEKRNHKLETARREKEISAEIDPECTFKPQIHLSQRSYKGSTVSKSLASRMEEWQRERDRRVQAARAVLAAELMAECTFEPSIQTSPVRKTTQQHRPVETKMPPSVSLRQEVNNEAFLSRMAAARAKAARLKEADQAVGKRYTGRITVPEAPQLATAQRKRLDAAPTQAPVRAAAVQSKAATPGSRSKEYASSPAKKFISPKSAAPSAAAADERAAAVASAYGMQPQPALPLQAPTVVMLPSGQAVLLSPGSAPIPVNLVTPAPSPRQMSRAASPRPRSPAAQDELLPAHGMAVSPAGLLNEPTARTQQAQPVQLPIPVNAIPSAAVPPHMTPQRTLPVPVSPRAVHAADNTAALEGETTRALDISARLRRELQSLLGAVNAAFEEPVALNRSAAPAATQDAPAPSNTPASSFSSVRPSESSRFVSPSTMKNVDSLLASWANTQKSPVAPRLPSHLGAIGAAALDGRVDDSMASDDVQLRPGRSTPTKPVSATTFDAIRYTDSTTTATISARGAVVRGFPA